MQFHKIAKWLAPSGMAALLLITVPPALAAVIDPPAADNLPSCPSGRAPRTAPTTPAGPASPGACRATGHILESAVQPSRPAEAGFTPAGYHHLGANTAGAWSGISGRFSVVNGSIRNRSYDFVAGRFMAKRDMGGGKIDWLEAGWAETGWVGSGQPHIYTFNTNTNTWQFYDQYTLAPGDRIWLDIHGDADGTWSAWLWWGSRWNLLTAQNLPIGASASIEQYVEVHVDASKPTRVDVPTVTVDNVQLRPAGGGPARFWRDDVPTLTGADPGEQQRTGGFCLNWINRYDTWTAGDCPDGGVFTTPAAPMPATPAEKEAPSESATAPTTPMPTPKGRSLLQRRMG